MINQLAKEVFENAKSKGFYDKPLSVSEKICLIHSELSEALEADRKGKYSVCGSLTEHMKLNKDNLDQNLIFKMGFVQHVKDTFEDELADTVIRCLDLAASMNINLEWHIKTKMRYNSMR